MTVLSRAEVEALRERWQTRSREQPFDLKEEQALINTALSALDRVVELERERDVCIKAWQWADSCTVQERERTAAAEQERNEFKEHRDGLARCWERDKAQVARLRAALEPFAESHDKVPRYEHVVAARAILGETPADKLDRGGTMYGCVIDG